MYDSGSVQLDAPAMLFIRLFALAPSRYDERSRCDYPDELSSSQWPGPISPLLYRSRVLASEMNSLRTALFPLSAAICVGVYCWNSASAEASAVSTSAVVLAPLRTFNFAAMYCDARL